MGSASHYKGNMPDLPIKQSRYQIEPRWLDIIWGRDPRYWRISESDGQPAELLQVCWLEVSGSIPLKKLAAGKYKIQFNVSLKPDAFGWAGSPIYLMVKVGSGGFKWKSYNLSALDPNVQARDIPDDFNFDVTDTNTEGDEKLHFGLYEIWRGRWKGGLLIHKVVITRN